MSPDARQALGGWLRVVLSDPATRVPRRRSEAGVGEPITHWQAHAVLDLLDEPTLLSLLGLRQVGWRYRYVSVWPELRSGREPWHLSESESEPMHTRPGMGLHLDFVAVYAKEAP